ncbi:unnamed protein product [Knipowitschia caucasica]
MKLLPTVALLSLLHVGHTAPAINCDSLTQKINIDSGNPLLGNWMYIAETSTVPGTKALTKKFVDSVVVNVTPLPDNRSIKFTQIQKTFGNCMSLSTIILVANNTMQMTKPYISSETLLTTGCPDCLVIMGNFTLGSSYYQSLVLLSKRRILSSAELDEFKNQASCLNLPAPAFLDPEKELCSEEQATAGTDLTKVLNSDMGSQIVGMLDTIISNPDGLSNLLNVYLGNLPITKGD